MSYSFSVKGATREEVEIKVRDELARVPEQQPVHKVDIDQAFEAAKSFLNLLRAPKEGEAIYASVSGSVWVGDGGEVNSAGVNVSVGFTTV